MLQNGAQLPINQSSRFRTRTIATAVGPHPGSRIRFLFGYHWGGTVRARGRNGRPDPQITGYHSSQTRRQMCCFSGSESNHQRCYAGTVSVCASSPACGQSALLCRSALAFVKACCFMNPTANTASSPWYSLVSGHAACRYSHSTHCSARR